MGYYPPDGILQVSIGSVAERQRRFKIEQRQRVGPGVMAFRLKAR